VPVAVPRRLRADHDDELAKTIRQASRARVGAISSAVHIQKEICESEAGFAILLILCQIVEREHRGAAEPGVDGVEISVRWHWQVGRGGNTTESRA